VEPDTLYERVGGQSFFDDLVDAFYRGVESDELLRPMYPSDLTESKYHLALFLAQYWGGPPIYSELRGHPRLRMRHAPFRITKRARDAWLAHMNAAVSEIHDRVSDLDRVELLSYLDATAHQLRNV
jgi:hemoglobin